MSGFVHSAALSSSSEVKAIEAEFALVGYARYIKLLELLAGNDGEPLAMSWDDWQSALSASHDALADFLAFCAELGALTMDSDADSLHQGELQRLVIGCPGLAIAAATKAPADDDALFTHYEQWASWFVDELSYPPSRANDAEHRRVFARWCASRVTVGDMNAAVQRATEQGTGLGAASLHGHLQALRAQRLKDANECF